jgi:hypothetical protein
MPKEGAFIRELAGTRRAQFELNALVLAEVVAEDRPGYSDGLAEKVAGLTSDDALVTPLPALGVPSMVTTDRSLQRPYRPVASRSC